nr:reverse transcriptase domain-containing protein [Tanacetum cinerariifolium]
MYHVGKTTDILFNLIRLFEKYSLAHQSQFLKALVLSSHHLYKCALRHAVSSILTNCLDMGFPPCEGNSIEGASRKLNLVLDWTVTDIEDNRYFFKPLSQTNNSFRTLEVRGLTFEKVSVSTDSVVLPSESVMSLAKSVPLHYTPMYHVGKTTDILFNLIRLFEKYSLAHQSQFLKALVLSSHHLYKCALRHAVSSILTNCLDMGFPPCEGNSIEGASRKLNLVLDWTVTDIEDNRYFFKPLSQTNNSFRTLEVRGLTFEKVSSVEYRSKGGDDAGNGIGDGVPNGGVSDGLAGSGRDGICGSGDEYDVSEDGGRVVVGQSRPGLGASPPPPRPRPYPCHHHSLQRTPPPSHHHLLGETAAGSGCFLARGTSSSGGINSGNLFPPLDYLEVTIRRRSCTDPTLLNISEMAAEGNVDLPVPDLRTMGELCQPSLNGRGGPIAPIAIQETNFRLKNDTIQQVKNSCQFHGLSGDDANKHLNKFLHVTQSIKVNGVTDEALHLYLFPYSLTHHATALFDRLPRNSINTFEQMAKMFLEKYFPPSMVTKLRNEITNFCQHLDESLFEAWERYKLSIDRCPNHNMLPVTQIDTVGARS